MLKKKRFDTVPMHCVEIRDERESVVSWRGMNGTNVIKRIG